ncbi:hypothetical protein K501DRAFT_333114 [Backusella circina FSU 941]|nr:hypothetical protein K501DRAFT_333114 [Backusella circina FSU 941]
MAFFSGIVKSSLSLLGKDNSGFGYSLGDKVEFFQDQSIWALHHGTKKEDGSEVSIFVFDCSKNRDRIQLARNAFKRLRTLRHPDVLRYLDGIETEQSIMFVTDPIEPLSSQLNQDPDKNLVIWGLYKIANAVKFINNDCGMVHGNVRVSSIFTNKAGEWKLGGFELLCSLKEESPIILTFGGLVPDAQRYAAPEVKKSGWTVIKDLPTEAVDSYHLGCLVYESYNHRFETTDSLLSQKGSIPANMLTIYKNLLNPSFRNRATADMFLDEGLRPRGFFSGDFVNVNLFLENISIKEQGEKEGFFRKLDSVIDTFPAEFSKHKILPELIKAFEFGSGGAKALSAIVKVGDHVSDEEYTSIIIEPIVRMFASPDRAIRVSLLENMPKFIHHMTNKMVTNQIYPNIATGFSDTIPIIREQTIKSILLLVPKLNERILNYDLLKHLAKLQMDPEPGIRTNTTICLGKMAKHLTDATRKKVLVPAFTRSLRDGFHHARIAALMALSATSEFYDPQDCAMKIIPTISIVLLDKEKPVRDQAFKAIQAFIKKTQDFADTMPETGIVPGSGTPNAEEAAAVNGAGMAGVLGGATKGLAGWAVSSIQSRFVSPSGEIGNPIQSPQNDEQTVNTPQPQQQQPQQQQPQQQQPQQQQPQQQQQPSSQRFGMQQEEEEEANGWDDEDSEPFDFGGSPQLQQDNDDGWNSFNKQESTPRTASPISPPISSFGSYPSSFGQSTHKAQGSMKLGHKTKPLDLNQAEVTQLVDTTTHSTKEERRAELERKREERRQKMADLREKKKGGLAQPTPSITPSSAAIAGAAKPTPFLHKRDDVAENLELYQQWANICRKNTNNNQVALVDSGVSVNNLWHTVTTTVNCGNGHAVTVTTTVSATATATATASSSCEGDCWSDYLWHTYGDNVSPAQGFVGVLCIIMGLYFTILAFRYFRPTMAAVGFIFFATMTWIGLVNNEPAVGYPLADLIYICVSAGLGILGAVFFVFFYPIGIYCLASLGGFYFAVYLLSWKANLVITIKVARVCFIIGLGFLVPFILYFIERYVVILCTALIGSYLFFFGLDFFAHTGFINPWLLIFDGNPTHHNTYLMSKPVYVMLGFVIVLFLISVGWQYYWHIYSCDRYFGITIEEAKVEEKKEEEKKVEEQQPMMMPGYMQPYCASPYFLQNVAMAPSPPMKQ